MQCFMKKKLTSICYLEFVILNRFFHSPSPEPTEWTSEPDLQGRRP